MADGGALSVTLVASLDEVTGAGLGCLCLPRKARQAAPPIRSPPTRFLHALEASGSVGTGTGWEPRHITVEQDGTLIAVAPHLCEIAFSGRIHSSTMLLPKPIRGRAGNITQSCKAPCPFTPATGRRFLCKPGFETAGTAAILQAMAQVARDNRLSSAHVTFCTAEEAVRGTEHGFLHRVTEQFHWENPGYASFDDFLAALSSRKRKTIRKERATAQDFGGVIRAYTGDDLQPKHWDAFWEFYQDTGARKWGTPYLSRAFFDIVQDTMRDDVLLVLAERDGEPIAGALNFIGRDCLYGRYWGCSEDHSCLHFELCYYQAMDFAIEHGLGRVEAGAQGTHKLARGYMPSKIHSLPPFPRTGVSSSRCRLPARRACGD